jgi:hypothetical protein
VSRDEGLELADEFGVLAELEPRIELLDLRGEPKLVESGDLVPRLSFELDSCER